MIRNIWNRMARGNHSNFSLLTRATASFAAILVLVLTVLASSPDLHQRLHGRGSVPAAAPGHSGAKAGQGQADDDGDEGCVVTLFAQGIILPIALLALACAGRVLRFIGAGADERVAVVAPRFLLLPSQAPPLGLG
jgi:hypothetical protein